LPLSSSGEEWLLRANVLFSRLGLFAIGSYINAKSRLMQNLDFAAAAVSQTVISNSVSGRSVEKKFTRSVFIRKNHKVICCYDS
jgi:hypothetical protein